MFGRIYEQMDPMRLGEYALAMLIAESYGMRLARKNLKDDALDRLIADYPSHDFVIDRNEATTLFNRVRPPTELESRVAGFFEPVVDAWLRNPREAITECLSSVSDEEEEKDAENEEPQQGRNAHAETGTKSGEVPSPTGPSDGSALGTSHHEPAQPSTEQTPQSSGKGDGNGSPEASDRPIPA